MSTCASAEVFVLHPPDPDNGTHLGAYRGDTGDFVELMLFRMLVGYLLDAGLDIEIGEDDTLPGSLPDRLDDHRALIVMGDDVDRVRDRLEPRYPELREWKYRSPREWKIFTPENGGPHLLVFGFPQELFHYKCPSVESLILNAGLTVDSSRLRRYMLERNDWALHRRVVEFQMDIERNDFTDVMNYITKSLFEAWQVRGEDDILDRVQEIFDAALDNVEFVDGWPSRKLDCPGTGIHFGYYLSMPTLVKLHQIRPCDRYDRMLRDAASEGPLRQRLEITDNWAPWPKGLHGLIAVLAYNDMLDQWEPEVLAYAEAGYRALHDPKTHLWKYFSYGGRTTPFFPAHGPALSLSHLVTILEHYPRDLPGYQRFLDMFIELAGAVRDYQDDAGTWYCILDEPTSCRRVDYTSLFAHAFLAGARHGWLDESFIEPARRAWPYVKQHLFQGGSFGNFGGISHSIQFNYYLMRPSLYDYHRPPPCHALMSANEILHLEKPVTTEAQS